MAKAALLCVCVCVCTCMRACGRRVEGERRVAGGKRKKEGRVSWAVVVIYTSKYIHMHVVLYSKEHMHGLTTYNTNYMPLALQTNRGRDLALLFTERLLWKQKTRNRNLKEYTRRFPLSAHHVLEWGEHRLRGKGKLGRERIERWGRSWYSSEGKNLFLTILGLPLSPHGEPSHFKSCAHWTDPHSVWMACSQLTMHITRIHIHHSTGIYYSAVVVNMVIWSIDSSSWTSQETSAMDYTYTHVHAWYA